MDASTLRILDAASNRATEGLRVVEDHARFVLEDRYLTRLVKELRHQLADVCRTLPWPERHASRDTQRDVGTEITTLAETKRLDSREVCIASLERTKQSLRSLEEYSKIDSPELSARFEGLRYQMYTLERCLGIGQESRLRLRGHQLCVLLDGHKTLDTLRALVTQLLDAGVGMLQLRDKTLADAELLERARLLRSMVACQGSTTILIVNDRPDIAALVNAEGVHLGQDDMCVKDARAILGPQKLIGVSTHSIEQARTAVLDGANYLGAGPTFPSTTKSFDQFPGLEFLRQLAGEIRLPTFAIGGIGAESLEQVLATGMTRVAASSAITRAKDPGEAAKQLLRLLPTTA